MDGKPEYVMSARLFNCLRRAGILLDRHLMEYSMDELKMLRGIGPKTWMEMVGYLEHMGYVLPEKRDVKPNVKRYNRRIGI